MPKATSLAAAAVLGLAAAAAAVDDSLFVPKARVRFRGPRADLRLDGDMTSARLPRGMDAAGPLVLEFAGMPLVRLPEDAAACRVSQRGGETRIRARRAFAGGGSLDLRLEAASGQFRVRARGLDASVVRAVGPSVPFRAVLGDAEVEGVLPFEEVGAKRWMYRGHSPVGGGAPGGGSGGAPPGLPPPPPDSTPLAITILAQGHGSPHPAPSPNVAWVVCRSHADLSAMWAKHAPGSPLPAVDFATEVVVGVFGGNPCLYHTASAWKAERWNDGIRVRVHLYGTAGSPGNGTHTVFRLTRSDGAIVPYYEQTIISTR